jgi:hypothetical protein
LLLGFLGVNVVLAESDYYVICEGISGYIILDLPRSDATSKQETFLDLTTSQATMTHYPARSGSRINTSVLSIEAIICHHTPPSPD